jgi:hypothetical protein
VYMCADFVRTTINPVVGRTMAKLSEPGRAQVAEAFFERAARELTGNPALVASAPAGLLPQGQDWADLVRVRQLHAADNFSYKCASG